MYYPKSQIVENLYTNGGELKPYNSNEEYTSLICLEKHESYWFILYDKFGDGMCCSHGAGYFRVSLSENDGWKEIISGGAFRAKKLNYVINLNEVKMTPRDTEWLDSHNSRRKKWHTSYGKSYGKHLMRAVIIFYPFCQRLLRYIYSSIEVVISAQR